MRHLHRPGCSVPFREHAPREASDKDIKTRLQLEKAIDALGKG
jgi:hypothetical protein